MPQPGNVQSAERGAHAVAGSSLGMLIRITGETIMNGSYQITPPSNAGKVGGVGACSLLKKLLQGFWMLSAVKNQQ